MFKTYMIVVCKLKKGYPDLFSFYLQLRSAMQAYGVPWGSALPTHPFHKLLASVGPTQGVVSKLYKFISEPYSFYW